MKIVQKVSLFYKEGSSDKVYHAQLAEVEGGFVVNFQYGRRGSTLATGTKTETPLPKDKAEKEYTKLVKSKTSKGYTEEESGEVFSSQEFEAKKTDILPQLSNSVDDPETYINDDDYIAQEKFNGERRMAEKTDSSTQGINRKGLAVQLPEVVEKSIKESMEIDGEIIGDKLYVFDVMSYKGKNQRNKKTTERLDLLASIKFGKAIEVVKTAYTKEEKRALFDDVKKRNAEGVIFKKKSAVYKVGRPNSGGDSLKFKFTKTATFIVAAHTKNKRSVELVVVEGKERVKVGKVTIPPNHKVPAVEALVEVEYLYAHKGGAIYQPVYLGERVDLDLSDATIDQLVYKEGQ